MKSNATSIEEYLAELPGDRREALEAVRAVILENLPEGYEEAFNWGAISYEVPLARYPDTYNKQPLMYVALASQKNHMALYLCSVYCTPEDGDAFREDYKKTGKKLDMGKSCVRFKRLEDLPLELIAKTITSTSVDDLIKMTEKAHGK